MFIVVIFFLIYGVEVYFKVKKTYVISCFGFVVWYVRYVLIGNSSPGPSSRKESQRISNNLKQSQTISNNLNESVRIPKNLLL